MLQYLSNKQKKKLTTKPSHHFYVNLIADIFWKYFRDFKKKKKKEKEIWKFLVFWEFFF